MITRKYIEEHYDIESDIGFDNPPPGIMYILHQNNKVVSVFFMCPCGCNQALPIPVNRHRSDWQYSPGPTISPSIRCTDGCKSYFRIINGVVFTHPDNGK